MLSKYKGSTKHLYVWNDMNEFSVFNGPEVRRTAATWQCSHHDAVLHGQVRLASQLLRVAVLVSTSICVLCWSGAALNSQNRSLVR